MIRFSISDFYKDCDFYLDHETYFYKRCKRPELFSVYADAFHKEYQLLRTLKQTYPDCRLFPVVHTFGRDRHLAPYLGMEYIRGITLEDYLCQYSQAASSLPVQLLSSGQLCRLLDQAFEALQHLYHCNVLYFDLTPSNIILTDTDTFDIKLIDFTFCYDLSLTEEENLQFSYKRNDSRVNPRDPLSLQIANAFLFFFIQLFYPGQEAYIQQFSSDDIAVFFEPNFGNLFRSLFSTADDFTRREQEHIDHTSIHGPLTYVQILYQKIREKLLFLQ